MFCQKCGEEVKKIDKFSGKCDGKQQQKTVTEKKEVKTQSLDSFKHFKREERAGHFKPSKSSASTSTITRKSKPLIHNVTINIGIMKNVNLNLKPVRGKKLPLKVEGALSGLRQFLAIENPLKMMKNAFYFTSKALFFLKIFKFLP